MPLYEYQCESCEHRFEKIQKFTDPNPETCPKCGSGPVRKLMSSPAIQFKGTGWYITDYAKKSGSEAGKTGTTKTESSEKADAPAKTESSESAAKTTDTAPATTTPKT
jgi:putative FmdB family regulatory protein